MQVEQDSSGNDYVEVANVRVTKVPETWSGDPGLRIQAKKSAGGLHRGAEIPIPDEDPRQGLLAAVAWGLFG